VSVVDLTCDLEREATHAAICAAMQEASEGALRGALGYSDEDIVSTDLRGEASSDSPRRVPKGRSLQVENEMSSPQDGFPESTESLMGAIRIRW
jgi:hypothetical protein